MNHENPLATFGMVGEFTEADLRALRDRVFGRPLTDHSWECIKANWAKPESLQWLREEAEKLNAKYG